MPLLVEKLLTKHWGVAEKSLGSGLKRLRCGIELNVSHQKEHLAIFNVKFNELFDKMIRNKIMFSLIK